MIKLLKEQGRTLEQIASKLNTNGYASVSGSKVLCIYSKKIGYATFK